MLWIFAFLQPVLAVTLIKGSASMIPSLDPYGVMEVASYSAMENIFETLARSNPYNGNMDPILAMSWSLDPENKKFRVRLRKGVKFHDGTILQPEDIKFTFESYFVPDYKAQVWQGMWADIESVRVVDEDNVEFKMRRWNYQAFENVLTSLRIFPRSFYQPVRKEIFQIKAIGTGPYKLKNFEPNKILDLEPNNDWWGQRKPLHSLRIKTVPSLSMAIQMVRRGELDFYEVESGQSASGPEFIRVRSGLGQGLWLDFNMENSIFRERKLRQAILLAWRREALNQKVFDSQMHLALDIFSPATDIYPPGNVVRSDVGEASRILKDLGYEDSNGDGILEKNGRPLELNILIPSHAQERWVTLLQNDLKAVGIRVKIKLIADETQWMKVLREGKFDAFVGNGGLINEATRSTWHSAGLYNYSHYSHPEVDRLTERLEAEFDLPKRRLILRKLISILREDCPQVPGLYSLDRIFLVSKRLQIDPNDPAKAWMWKLR